MRSIAGEVIPYYYSHCIRTSSPFPPIFRLFALSGPKSPTKGGESVEILQKTFLFHFYPI